MIATQESMQCRVATSYEKYTLLEAYRYIRISPSVNPFRPNKSMPFHTDISIYVHRYTHSYPVVWVLSINIKHAGVRTYISCVHRCTWPCATGRLLAVTTLPHQQNTLLKLMYACMANQRALCMALPHQFVGNLVPLPRDTS
jgi:hypothetical protein